MANFFLIVQAEKEQMVTGEGRFGKDFAPPMALMGMIFILSSIPGKVDNESLKFLTELDPNFQNLLHIPLFGLLQVLWLRSFWKRGRNDWRAVLTCLAISLGYGIIDECHQFFIPGRFASVLDLGLNLVGVLIGTIGFILFTLRFKRAEC